MTQQQWPSRPGLFQPRGQLPQGQWGGQGWGAPQGQPWGFPGGGQPVFVPQPPRRPSLLGRLLRALLMLGLLGFLGLMLLGYLVSRVAAQSTPTEPSTAPTATAAPTGGTTPTQPSTTSPSTAPSGAYQNDDYVVPPANQDPPPLPEPDTYQQATQLLEANKLYNQAVPRPVRCEMGVIDTSRASRAELTTHLNQMMGCLMRVWEQPLRQAGYTAVRPSVTVYSGSISTKCGKLGSMNASYCGADQQVYYADDLYYVVPRQLRSSRFITESVVAHEFGHAVQARSGILVSGIAWEDKASKSASLQYSRRLEVQADCFAGEFLGSVQQSTGMTQPELGNVEQLFHSIGDDVLTGRAGYEGNHGSGANREAWTTTGLANTKVGACNTFTAPASRVR